MRRRSGGAILVDIDRDRPRAGAEDHLPCRIPLEPTGRSAMPREQQSRHKQQPKICPDPFHHRREVFQV